MHQKLIGACLTIVAVAMLPSLASANPFITHPTGTALAPGAKFLATDIGATEFTTPAGNISCTNGTMTGTLKTNSKAGGFTAEITSATFAGTGAQAAGEPAKECTGTGMFAAGTSVTPNPMVNALPWCLAGAVTTDAFTLAGGACGGKPRGIRLSFALTNVGTCTYEREPALSGSLETDTAAGKDAVFAFSLITFLKKEGPILCPDEMKWDMTFTLETDAVLAEPFYISS
jgi:hypothetical protein